VGAGRYGLVDFRVVVVLVAGLVVEALCDVRADTWIALGKSGLHPNR
jgi:hypothetical protein